MQTPNPLWAMLKDVEIMTAIVFGAFMQFIFGDNRSIKVGVTIILSSIFVAVYIVAPFVIPWLDISDEQIKAGIYATSSLISVELMAILIAILPTAAKDKAIKYFGVKNDPCDPKRKD